MTGLQLKRTLALSLRRPGKVQFPGTAERWQSDSANSHFPASGGENDPARELGTCPKLEDQG